MTIHGDRKHPGPGACTCSGHRAPGLASSPGTRGGYWPHIAASPRSTGAQVPSHPEAGGQAASTPHAASTISPVKVPILGLALCSEWSLTRRTDSGFLFLLLQSTHPLPCNMRESANTTSGDVHLHLPFCHISHCSYIISHLPTFYHFLHKYQKLSVMWQ